MPRKVTTEYIGNIAKRTASDRREYDIPGIGACVSVTTTLGILAQPWLGPWFAKEERSAILAAVRDVYAHLESGKVVLPTAAFVAAVEQQVGKEKSALRKSRQAMDIGTEVHAWAEWWSKRALGQDLVEPALTTDAAKVAAMSFEDWAKGVALRPVYVETVVYSKTHRYAGTVDLIAFVEGRLTVVDLKAAKQCSWSYLLQSVAYQWAAREMGLVTEPTVGLIVRLPKTLDDLTIERIPVPWDDKLFDMYRSLVPLWTAFRAWEDRASAA